MCFPPSPLCFHKYNFPTYKVLSVLQRGEYSTVFCFPLFFSASTADSQVRTKECFKYKASTFPFWNFSFSHNDDKQKLPMKLISYYIVEDIFFLSLPGIYFFFLSAHLFVFRRFLFFLCIVLLEF